MKGKTWFSLEGVRSEIKNIRWLNRKELIHNSTIVILFCFIFGVYFYLSDAVIAIILKLLGMK